MAITRKTHMIYIGADIGGSHITCKAVNAKRMMIMEACSVRREVNSGGSAEDILSSWSEALSVLIAQTGLENLAGIGFAMPGPFDYPTGLALFEGVRKYDHVKGINVREELVKRLGLGSSVSVRFLNDATCFAVGEAWIGKASEFSRTVAITLGTGFGSAFLDQGIPVEKGEDVPRYGCVYHLPFGNSMADDYFSTRWFVSRYHEMTGKHVTGVKEIADAASREGPALSVFREFGRELGLFLAPWLLRFHAGFLTIGGNIANSYPLFSEPFLAALTECQFASPVSLSELGENAAIAGAARLCDDAFYALLPFNSNK
jgi:glucokinase